MKELALGLAAVLMACLFAGCGGKQQAALDNYFKVVQGFDEFPFDERVVDLVEASIPLLGISDKELQKREEWGTVTDETLGSKYSFEVLVGIDALSVSVFTSEEYNNSATWVVYNLVIEDCRDLKAERLLYAVITRHYGAPFDENGSPYIAVDGEPLSSGIEGLEMLESESLPLFDDRVYFSCQWPATINGQKVAISLISFLDASGEKTVSLSVLVK